MPSFEEIKSMALALPEEARVQLAEELFGSVDQSDSNAIHPEWVEEIRRRMADYKKGLIKTIPGEEVLAKIRAGGNSNAQFR